MQIMTHQFCPHCGALLDDDEPPCIVDQLKQACAEKDWPVFPGDRVSELVAAQLLGRALGTLRNWRSGSRPLAFVRNGSGRGRVSYKLSDLAKFLDREPEDEDACCTPE